MTSETLSKANELKSNIEKLETLKKSFESSTKVLPAGKTYSIKINDVSSVVDENLFIAFTSSIQDAINNVQSLFEAL